MHFFIPLCYSYIGVINLIIQIKGNVKYPITLDPSVWIFDDRKILLEDAFKDKVIEKK